jgi:hypothetical protein
MKGQWNSEAVLADGSGMFVLLSTACVNAACSVAHCDRQSLTIRM